ncbi:hypothetical protein LCGC14_2396460, partial [marine sediment metagenome]
MTLKLSEADLASWLEELFDIHGYRWVHFRPARVKRGDKDTYETPYTGSKGFPDYVACHPIKHRLLFVEIKSEDGKVGDEQYDWLCDLKEC